MLRRQRMLLGLIDLLEKLERPNKLNKLTLVKMLFLIAKEHPPKFAMYGFHPYEHGPFSTEMGSDLSYFRKKGFIEDDDNSVRVSSKGKSQGRLEPGQERFVKSILAKYPDDNALTDYIHGKYPEYTIRSKPRKVSKKNALKTEPGFFLIGYEGRSIDEFIHVLVLNDINILVDVRRNARSMKYDFNKGRLEKAVDNLGIKYLHVPELGIAPEKRKNLDSRMDREQLFAWYARELPRKMEYIEKIETLGKKQRVALMCFESDAQCCHRREIGRILAEKGHPVSST